MKNAATTKATVPKMRYRTSVIMPKYLITTLLFCLPVFATVRNVKTTCGAAGNGSTDDTAAINSCIALLVNGDTLEFPAGTYKISSQLRINVSNVIIDGSSNAATILSATTGQGPYLLIGTQGINNNTVSCSGWPGIAAGSALSATANETATSFSTTSTLSGVTAGSYAFLVQGGQDSSGGSGNTGCDTSGCRGEFVKVTGVSGSTYTVDTMLHDTFSPSVNNAMACPVTGMLTGVTLQNITVDGGSTTAQTTGAVWAIQFNNTVNSTISGVTCQNTRGSCLLHTFNYGLTITNLTVKGAGSENCGAALQGYANSNVAASGISLSSLNPSTNLGTCLVDGAFGWEEVNFDNSTATNSTVTSSGTGGGRPMKITATRWSTFNNLTVENGTAAFNGLSYEYYSSHDLVTGGSILNNSPSGGSGTAGINTFGNFNQFNTFYNLTVTGNGNTQIYSSDFDALRLAADANASYYGSTFGGSGTIGLNQFGQNACVLGNTFQSGMSTGIFIGGTGTVGANNTLNGNSSNLTAGACSTTGANGSGALASINPSSLSFGNQALSTSASLGLTVTNGIGIFKGTNSLSVISAALVNGTQFAITANTCTAAIAPGATCSFTITFTPTSAGAQSDTLIFLSNAGGAMQSIALSGTGTGSVLHQCPAPAYSCFSTSLATIPNGSTPNIGNLTGAGTTFSDPNFGAVEARGSDANFDGYLPDSTMTVAGSGSGDESHWSLNDDRLIISDNGGRNFPAIVSWGSALTPMYVGATYTHGFYTFGGGLFFGHNANTPYRLYSYGNGTAGTGSNSGFLVGYYDVTSTVTPPTFTQLFDFTSDLNTAAGGSFGGVTWVTAGESDQTDTDFAEGFSNNGSQAGPGACYVGIYRQGSGGRVWNICTGTITGDWGATGTASTPFCSGGRIHNVKIYKAGGNSGAVIVTEDGGTGCPVGGYVWFYNGTTVTAECTAQCSGHFTEGNTTYANESGNNPPAANYWSVRSNTNVGAPTSIVPNFPTAGRPVNLDFHCGWNFIDDTYPFDCTTYKTDGSAINGGWQNELDFLRPVSANPIRMLQTYNTGQSNNFSVQIAVGSCSQDGNYCAYTSDWQGTLGSTAGGATCTLNTNCRGDVILVQLNAATGAATPSLSPAAGTYTGPLTVTATDSTAGTVMCWNLTGAPKTNRVSGCAPGSTLLTGGIPLTSSATVYVVAGGGGHSDGSVASSAYTINTNAVSPTFSPGAGTYTGTQSVTLSTTAGTVICYNTTGSPATNGSTGCTTGTHYTSPVSVSVNETLYAVAGGTGYVDSPVSSAAYIVKTLAATPTFSPIAGTYSGTQSVAISTTSGLVICYTTNGTTPQTNGTTGCTTGSLYSTPVSVASSETVKAIAGGTGYTDSAVASAAYTIVAGANVPTFSPVGGTYTGTQSVTISTTTGGAIICYNTTGAPKTNGVSGCTTGTLYSTPVSVSSSETLYAVAGGTGFTDSTVGSATYTILTTASTPTFSPVAGTYTGTQTVTISSTSPGATICYNTTGSPSTNGGSGCASGTVYSGPVTVSVSETLYAVAGGTGYSNSSVGSAAYTINTGAATPTFSPIAGTYASAQNVAITSTSAGAIICWNTTGSPHTNGSTGCSAGTKYTGAVNVTASETLYAVAGGTGFTDSSVGSAAYVIETAAAQPTFSPVAGTYASTQSVTISAASGSVICYNFTGAPKTNGASGCSVGTLYTGAVSVSTSETLYAVSGGTGFLDSTVGSATYVLNTGAATPTFNPLAGTYPSTQSVALSTTSSGAIICYTTNGTNPATNGSSGCTTGSLYSTAISVSSSETVKAVAGGTGFNDSAVGSAAYVIRTSASTPTFSPVAGTYTGSQSVTISTTTGTVICYTVDGSTPATNGGTGCTAGTLYASPVTVASNLTLKAIAGGSIYNDSSVGTAAYVINYNASTPTFSPVAGTYNGSQSVTISSSAGAIICYTTNGTSPATNGSTGCTTGTLYSGPVTVSSSLTLKAVGGGTGFNDSSVGSAAYTINTGAATPTFSPLAGTYATSQNVALSTTSGGAIICYTTNGTSPATNGVAGCTTGTLYSTAIAVSVSETIKAVAGGTGFTDSSVGSAAYVIRTAAATPTFSPVAGTYTGSQSVTISTTTGSVICYTTNGSTPATNGASGCATGTLYTGAVPVASNLILTAVAGGSIYNDSSVGSAAYVINYNASTPTFSPGAGTYNGTQTVTISSSGGVICYTTNGNNPGTNGASGCVTGTLYTAPITVSSSLTVKAVGGGTGFNDSSVGSAAYVITAIASTPSFNPPAGSYASGQNVTITSSGGVICWNFTGAPQTNGSTGCTNGNLYTGPVSVPSSSTLFAVGGGTGFTDSAVGSAVYVIAPQPPSNLNVTGPGSINGGGSFQN